MDCQNQAPRRWSGHADVQKKSIGPRLQSGGSCHWAPETGRCSGQVRPHLAGILRLWSVDQREKAWLFWSQCWVRFFSCLKMKTSLSFPRQGGFSPMSGNVVDHQQDRMMEKCKPNQIGVKTNIMLWYQAIEALSIYLVLRTLLLACIWTEPDTDLFIHLVFLDLVIRWALCVDAGCGCPSRAIRSVGNLFSNYWKIPSPLLSTTWRSTIVLS